MSIGKPGPFQIIESEVQGSLDNPINAPRRRYDCLNYETCLVIAAGLNWDSFTCRGCNGEVEEALSWRARQEINKDNLIKKIFDLPNVCINNGNGALTDELVGDGNQRSVEESVNQAAQRDGLEEDSRKQATPEKQAPQRSQVAGDSPPNRLKVVGK